MLEIKNITVEVEEKTVVSDATCEIESGAVSVLMGPNGSGKSSLMNAVAGHPHYMIKSGSILLDDEDITKLSPPEKAKRGIFLSLQRVPRIGGVTLATFLHKVHNVLHEKETPVLEFYAKLVDEAQKFSLDRTLLDRPLTAGLSGGEQKQSELLQLLALRPRIAILDEIDSGVDIDALHALFKVIEALKQEGTGFAIISHHPSLLDHVTPRHVYVMRTGEIVQKGERALAQEILTNGFCAIAECPHLPNCVGRCKDNNIS